MSMDSFPASIPHQVPQVGLKTSSSQPSEAQQHHSPGSQNSQSRSSTLAALLIELTSYGGEKMNKLTFRDAHAIFVHSRKWKIAHVYEYACWCKWAMF